MKALPEPVAALVDLLGKAADELELPYAVRLKAAVAARRAILPRKTPGKKSDHRIDNAYTDYRTGVRGLELYRKHIPHHDRLSRWRRVAEEHRLLKNLQKRAQREKKARRQRETNTSAELSGRQFPLKNCPPDISPQAFVAAVLPHD
jgi:hypothetical protein